MKRGWLMYQSQYLEGKVIQKHADIDDELLDNFQMKSIDGVDDKESESDFEEIHVTGEQNANIYDAKEKCEQTLEDKFMWGNLLPGYWKVSSKNMFWKEQEARERWEQLLEEYWFGFKTPRDTIEGCWLIYKTMGNQSVQGTNNAHSYRPFTKVREICYVGDEDIIFVHLYFLDHMLPDHGGFIRPVSWWAIRPEWCLQPCDKYNNKPCYSYSRFDLQRLHLLASRHKNGNFYPGGDHMGEGPGLVYNINVPWENAQNTSICILPIPCINFGSMEGIDVDETTVVSDISEGFSSGSEGGDDEELLAEPTRGVHNGDLPLFVNKLYDMVCNKETDSIISWVPNVSGGTKSFAIWNIDEFIKNVLPLKSKSKNCKIIKFC
ncbi:winged helix-turn-helix DNA-binding domain, Heat shock transcription factor family [Artemisia annua]|uniref:Winged helix-turn-helix DNA-binding domain, Heat shock transcription factor family n=1 Tax=Artemisia annua TaxID=35608 RepID=A0A2U1QC62_ARTAN|nr:winged helix-turn-helix DNA-binding domain, Heat shock transcription factor family [Artemisia annua]